MLIYLIIVKTKFTPPVFPNTILLHIICGKNYRNFRKNTLITYP